MADPVPRKAPDPIAAALAFAIRRAVQRRAAEIDRRRTMTVMDGGKRPGHAA